MINIQSIPYLRFGIAGLAVVAFVGARDIPVLSPSATLILTAAVATLLLALLSLELLVSRLPTRPWFRAYLRVTAALAIVGIPLIHGLPAYWNNRTVLPGWSAVALAVGGLVAGALVAFARVPLGYDQAKWARATVVTSVLLGSLLYWVHTGTGTMESVRPTTEQLHIVLFVGTWIFTAGCAALYAARFAGSPSSEQTGRSLALGAAVCSLGIALAEVDRRMLVSLYEEVHVWLGLLALLLIELGVRMALLSRRSRGWSGAGAASWTVLLGLVLGGFFGRAGFAEVSVRTELLHAPLGASLIHLTPRPAAKHQARQVVHPALQYDQMLSTRRRGRLPNILLITVDAWRFDSVVPGGAKPRMPYVAALAAKSVLFTRAYAQGARTAQAMGALMLGRYSANIDWRLLLWKSGRVFDPAEMSEAELAAMRGKAVNTTLPAFGPGRTLAERLKGKGYHTVATPFAGRAEFFKPGLGFDSGFDDFADLTDDKWKSPSSRKVVARAIEQHARIPEGAPWFHWVHLFDPHESKNSLARYKDLLKHTDTAIKRLIGAVKKRAGDWSNTIVVLVADHGEAFGEHGMSSHATSLYDEQVRVPLIIRVPGIAPRVEETLVAALDVTATLTAMAGADTEHLDGVNLWPLLSENEYPESRPVFTELHRYMSKTRSEPTTDLKAVVWGQHKLIVNRRADAAELFDMQEDPGEGQNLLLADPETYERLSDLLEGFLGGAEAEHPLP